jgi:hypothetical protein
MPIAQTDMQKAALLARLASIPLEHENRGMTEYEFADYWIDRVRKRDLARGALHSPPKIRNRIVRQHFDSHSELQAIANESDSDLSDTGLDRIPAKELKAIQRDFARLFPKATLRRNTPDRRLASAHHIIRNFFVELFDPARSAPVVLPGTDSLAYQLNANGSIVVSMSADSDAVSALARLLSVRPLPFGRCRNCGVSFVRRRRQVHCSEKCRIDRNENARRGKRTAYMRDLMRRKREREAARTKAKAKK